MSKNFFASNVSNESAESRYFFRLAKYLIPRKNKVHVAVFLLTLLLIPSAITALEPID